MKSLYDSITCVESCKKVNLKKQWESFNLEHVQGTKGSHCAVIVLIYLAKDLKQRKTSVEKQPKLFPKMSGK